VAVRISVAVCTFNRAEVLRRCLKSLLAQSYKGPYEVVLVNNGCVDHTEAVVKEEFERADDRVSLEYVAYATNQGLGAARNTALARASGDIIVYTDDDTVADRDWVKHIVECFDEHPEIVAAGGPVLNGHVDSAIAEIGQQIVTAGLHRYMNDDGYTRFLVGNNQAYRTEAARKAGGFEQELLIGGEEAELQSRLMETGGRMLFSPGIVVTHYQRTTVPSLMKQYYRYGIGIHKTKKKYAGASDTSNMFAERRSLWSRLAQNLGMPFSVMKHLEKPYHRFLALPLVYLAYLSRATGYLVAKASDRFAIVRALVPRA
jgi:glucosyl-dolichyl phosphate glucuronosyltransferase